MGGGKQNNNQDIMPPAIKEEEDEDVVAEIAAKKNRERFAINKSYSIEVSYFVRCRSWFHDFFSIEGNSTFFFKLMKFCPTIVHF